MKKLFLLLWFCAGTISVVAQRHYTVTSPDGKLSSQVSVGEILTYTISHNGEEILTPSPISMTLADGTIWGKDTRIKKVTTGSIDQTIAASIYRKKQVRDHYNYLTLHTKQGWSVEFRAYNDGVAYRLISHKKEPIVIKNEQVAYRFAQDGQVTLPYVRRGKDGDFADQFRNSFENPYTIDTLSKMDTRRLAFLPFTVDVSSELKVCLTETDLNHYPGLYLVREEGKPLDLMGVLPTYPKAEKRAGSNFIQMWVTEREDYIAKVDAPRSFPWRVAVIGDDLTIANSDLNWLLSEPSRIEDTSWIKPGKAMWDWWYAWNIAGVDFRAGKNTETYKYLIDFAASNNIEYVLMDDGWSTPKEGDLMNIIDEIDMKAIVEYGTSKGVGILLWAGYYAFERDMENVCKHYSEMGIKGFKVDFMDRDDQCMVAFNHKAAATAAKYHLVLDLHGTYKPAGINRTWPNVLTVEGVWGQENTKWNKYDQVEYDVQIPFIRQVSGPMDYTPGAMLNASKRNYFPCRTEPMSQGTRCHQLALYIILDSPLVMLCDSPTHYNREKECMEFLSQVPTVWDDTRVLAGEEGEYVVMARRSGNTWYIGGITDWNPRDLEIDLSSLNIETSTMTLYRDGINADRKASDYKKEQIMFNSDSPWGIHLAPGGGFVAIIESK